MSDEVICELTAEQKDVIESVWESMKHLSVVELSNLTHLPGSAWSRTREGLPVTSQSRRQIELTHMAADAGRLLADTQQKLSTSWDQIKSLEKRRACHSLD